MTCFQALVVAKSDRTISEGTGTEVRIVKSTRCCCDIADLWSSFISFSLEKDRSTLQFVAMIDMYIRRKTSVFENAYVFDISVENEFIHGSFSTLLLQERLELYQFISQLTHHQDLARRSLLVLEPLLECRCRI